MPGIIPRFDLNLTAADLAWAAGRALGRPDPQAIPRFEAAFAAWLGGAGR